MGGVNGERVNKIASDFNATQSDYKVVPVYKGNYTRDHDRRHRRVPGPNNTPISCRYSRSAPPP